MSHVLIAYVDESYDHDFYFVGAAIADYDSWDALARRYEAFRAETSEKHNVPPTASRAHRHTRTRDLRAARPTAPPRLTRPSPQDLPARADRSTAPGPRAPRHPRGRLLSHLTADSQWGTKPHREVRNAGRIGVLCFETTHELEQVCYSEITTAEFVRPCETQPRQQ